MQEEANLFNIQSPLSLSGIKGREKMGWKLDFVWLASDSDRAGVHSVESQNYFISLA